MRRLEGPDGVRVAVRYDGGRPFVDIGRHGSSVSVPTDIVPQLIAALVLAASYPPAYTATDPEAEPSALPVRERAATSRRAPRRRLPEPSPDPSPRGPQGRERSKS